MVQNNKIYLNKKKINKKKQLLMKTVTENKLPFNKQYMGSEPFVQRDFAPSNYIHDKYSQYRIGMDNYWPLQITEMPFYNDVYYSMPNSLGSPIYTKPSYETMQNASFTDTLLSQQYIPNNDTSQYALIDRQFPGLQFENMNSFTMEKDSYFNTMNSTNKDIDYKKFISQKMEGEENDENDNVEPIKREIKYIDKNKNLINMSTILLLLIILLLNF